MPAVCGGEGALDERAQHVVPEARIRVPSVRAHSRRRLDEKLARLWEHRLGLGTR